MIINVINNNDYQANPRLNMIIIRVILKILNYQVILRLIIKEELKSLWNILLT